MLRVFKKVRCNYLLKKNPCNQLVFDWYRLTFCLAYPFLYKKDRLRQSVASHLDFARCFGTKSKEDFSGASEKMLRNLTALVLPTWKSPPDHTNLRLCLLAYWPSSPVLITQHRYRYHLAEVLFQKHTHRHMGERCQIRARFCPVHCLIRNLHSTSHIKEQKLTASLTRDLIQRLQKSFQPYQLHLEHVNPTHSSYFTHKSDDV